MDKIFLRGMKADTLIGVYDWERERPQTLILDLDAGLDDSDAYTQRAEIVENQLGDVFCQ